MSGLVCDVEEHILALALFRGVSANQLRKFLHIFFIEGQCVEDRLVINIGSREEIVVLLKRAIHFGTDAKGYSRKIGCFNSDNGAIVHGLSPWNRRRTAPPTERKCARLG